MSSIPNKIGRLYLQFLIIVFIAFVFAYALNYIFLIEDAEMRVAMSSVFLALFAGSIMILGRA